MDEFRRRSEENAEEAQFALLLDDKFNELEQALLRGYEDEKARGRAEDMPEDVKRRLRRFLLDQPEAAPAARAERERDTVRAPAPSAGRRALNKWLRRLGVAAAALGIVFGTMLTVQACGVDLFGAIGRWTDSIFYYGQQPLPTEPAQGAQTPLKELAFTMLQRDVSLDYAPGWLPERFTQVEIDPASQSDGSEPDFGRIIAVFHSEQGDRLVFLATPASLFETSVYEKDEGSVELYSVRGRDYYLFTNMGSQIASSRDSRMEISIIGDVTRGEMKQILDSIGSE